MAVLTGGVGVDIEDCDIVGVERGLMGGLDCLFAGPSAVEVDDECCFG